MGLFSFRKKEAESVAPRRGSRTRSSRTAAGEYSEHEQLDPLLPEKQRARRRLVGALALVLAAVIILPMVLAPEPKPDTSDIVIQIPNKDANLPPVQAKDTTAQSLDSGEEEVAAAGQNDGAAKAEAPAGKTQDGKAAAAPPASADSAKEAAKPAAAPAEKSADKSADRGSADKAVEKKPPAKPVDKTADKGAANTAPHAAANTASADTKGRFLIRIGAFSDHQRANNWLVKLKLADVPSYIETKKMDDGRTLYLLRSGPFSSRESAEAAGKKVRQMGLTAQIAEAS